MPRGPELENIKYRMRPSATVGTAIILLNRPFRNDRPLNRRIPRRTPIGMPTAVAIRAAIPETNRLRNVISRSSDSNDRLINSGYL
jgi:hypothetical protein